MAYGDIYCNVRSNNKVLLYKSLNPKHIVHEAYEYLMRSGSGCMVRVASARPIKLLYLHSIYAASRAGRVMCRLRGWRAVRVANAPAIAHAATRTTQVEAAAHDPCMPAPSKL